MSRSSWQPLPVEPAVESTAAFTPAEQILPKPESAPEALPAFEVKPKDATYWPRDDHRLR